MNITLIKPSMMTIYGGDSAEPLAFGILAALTPPDVTLRMFDERIEPIDFAAPADLAAISCDTFSARRAYQVAAEFRRRGVPVVMGGLHPTLCPDEVRRFAESVVVGDAEDTWPAVVADARGGRLQRLYRSQNPPLTDLRIDRSIFAGKRYGSMRFVQFGRGCPHACDFCSIHAFYGNTIRHRPVEHVIAEIEALRARTVIFTDDNLLTNRPLAMELLERLVPLRVRWACQVTLSVADDPEMLALMARSGCMAVQVGLESLRDDNLVLMRKARGQSARHYADSIRRIHARGIMIFASFVFGYDNDTPEDFARTLDFSIDNKLLLSSFNPLIPMPNTPLLKRLRAEGRLRCDPWWLDPEFRYGESFIHPLGMTAEEMTEGIFRIRRRFNSAASIARRALNVRANTRNLFNAAVYFTVNRLNRREVYRKQGRPLGDSTALEPMTDGAAG